MLVNIRSQLTICVSGLNGSAKHIFIAKRMLLYESLSTGIDKVVTNVAFTIVKCPQLALIDNNDQ